MQRPEASGNRGRSGRNKGVIRVREEVGEGCVQGASSSLTLTSSSSGNRILVLKSRKAARSAARVICGMSMYTGRRHISAGEWASEDWRQAIWRR